MIEGSGASSLHVSIKSSVSKNICGKMNGNFPVNGGLRGLL